MVIFLSEEETNPVVMTGADIICTVDGCGKPAKMRVLPVTFQRVMLCDEHYERIGGRITPVDSETEPDNE
jgi:hypothetical protein